MRFNFISLYEKIEYHLSPDCFKIFKKIGFSHILGGGYVVSFTHYAKGLIGVFLYLKLRSKGKVKYYT